MLDWLDPDVSADCQRAWGRLDPRVYRVAHAPPVKTHRIPASARAVATHAATSLSVERRVTFTGGFPVRLGLRRSDSTLALELFLWFRQAQQVFLEIVVGEVPWIDSIQLGPACNFTGNEPICLESSERLLDARQAG